RSKRMRNWRCESQRILFFPSGLSLWYMTTRIRQNLWRIFCGRLGRASIQHLTSTPRKLPCSVTISCTKRPSLLTRAPSRVFLTSSLFVTILLNSWIVAGASIFQRDFDREHRAAFRSVRCCERAAVLGDDAVRQRESDAVTAGLGCEEGNEDLLQLRRGNAGS